MATRVEFPIAFKFWDSYSRAIEGMESLTVYGLEPDEVEQTKMRFTYDIAQYGAYLRKPDWSKYDARVQPIVQMAWELALPNLQSSQKASITGKSGGKKGGRPRKQKEAETPVEYGGDLQGWDNTSIARELN